MPDYQVSARNQADQLDAAAEMSSALVHRDIQRSSDYVLTVVLYAVALFFAGMSTRVGSRRLRWVLTVTGCLVFASAIAWLATFPVSVSV
jgi:hypothetical protein